MSGCFEESASPNGPQVFLEWLRTYPDDEKLLAAEHFSAASVVALARLTNIIVKHHQGRPLSGDDVAWLKVWLNSLDSRVKASHWGGSTGKASDGD